MLSTGLGTRVGWGPNGRRGVWQRHGKEGWRTLCWRTGRRQGTGLEDLWFLKLRMSSLVSPLPWVWVPIAWGQISLHCSWLDPGKIA